MKSKSQKLFPPSTLILFFFACSSHAFNITQILSQYSDLSAFNDALTQTQVASSINSRQTITVLAVGNEAMSGLPGSQDAQRALLTLHVILDYFDPQKLQSMPNRSATLTTLYQTSGLAHGMEGFLNATVTNGGVQFGSAVPGSSLGSNLVKLVVAQPYNISVLQVTGFIVPPNLGGGTNPSAPSQSQGTPPQGSSSTPGSIPDTPPAAGGSTPSSGAGGPSPSSGAGGSTPSSGAGGSTPSSAATGATPPSTAGPTTPSAAGGAITPSATGSTTGVATPPSAAGGSTPSLATGAKAPSDSGSTAPSDSGATSTTVPNATADSSAGSAPQGGPAEAPTGSLSTPTVAGPVADSPMADAPAGGSSSGGRIHYSLNHAIMPITSFAGIWYIAGST